MDFIDHNLSWTDIISPEDNQYYSKVVQKAIKNKTPYQVEYRIKKADDSTVFIQEQAHLVSDDKGKVTYIDGVFLNATQYVKKYEEYERLIINKTSKPLLVYYVDSYKKIKYINNYFVEICNSRNADDLIGLTPSDIIESNTIVRDAKYKSVAEEVLETGKGVYNLEGFIKFRGADRALYLMVSALPVRNEAGVINGSLMVMTDLTKIKDKEEEIKALLNYTNLCLKNLREGLKKFGEGYLECHLEKIKDDQFGKTFDEFNRIVLNLKSIIENTMKDMTRTLEEANEAEEFPTR